MRRHQRRLLLVIGLTGALLGVVAYQVHALRSLELDTVDKRFSIRGAKAAPRDLVIVTIDERTQDRLRRRFPFPRRFHARAIDRLSRDGARAIAYDVEF